MDFYNKSGQKEIVLKMLSKRVVIYKYFSGIILTIYHKKQTIIETAISLRFNSIIRNALCK